MHSSELKTFHDKVQNQEKDQIDEPGEPTSEMNSTAATNSQNTKEPQQIRERTAADRKTIANKEPSACQPTLQHHQSHNQMNQDLSNQGNITSVHGASHQGPRTMLIVHTAH